nr:WAS/WASL-interacting protein family member 1-like [Marmota flaviventris]
MKGKGEVEREGSLEAKWTKMLRGGGGGGRDGAAHSGGSSAPGLGCGVLGGGGSGGGSGPARAVTIVRSGRRSPAEPLSSRRRQRQPWPPALAPPAPGTLRWLARLPRSAPARGTARAARPAPRAPTLTHNRALGGSRAGCGTRAGDTSFSRPTQPAGAAMETRTTATPVRAL